MNLKIIRHRHKKPACREEVLSFCHDSVSQAACDPCDKFHMTGGEDTPTSIPLLPSQICIIGDRVLTDVVFGRNLGAYTILTGPLTTDMRLDHPTSVILR